MTSSALEPLALEVIMGYLRTHCLTGKVSFICLPGDITVHRKVDLQDVK